MSYLVTGVPASSYSLSSPFGESHGISTNLPSHGQPSTSRTDTFKLSQTPNKITTQANALDGAAKPASTVAPAPKVDTVQLSTEDKVRSLRQEGEADVQIAATLNLSTKEVENDLYVDTKFPRVVSTAVQSASAAGAPNLPTTPVAVSVAGTRAA